MKPITCTVCQTTNPPESVECSECGYEFNRVDEVKGDATGGIVPYNNPPALSAYYLAIVSLIPVVGLITGFFAIRLGRKGLQLAREHPQVGGRFHAWIGIGCGGLSLLVGGVSLIYLIVAIVYLKSD